MLSTIPSSTNSFTKALEFLRPDGQGETYSLEAAATSDGRLVFDPNGGKGGKGEIYPEYHHRDHLGNTRVAFTDRDEDGKVELLGANSEVVQLDHRLTKMLSLWIQDKYKTL